MFGVENPHKMGSGLNAKVNFLKNFFYSDKECTSITFKIALQIQFQVNFLWMKTWSYIYKIMTTELKVIVNLVQMLVNVSWEMSTSE